MQKYISETTKEEFMKRTQNYDAVNKQVDLLGEQVSLLFKDDPDSVIQKFNGVPWAEIRALRNRSSHDYFSLNPETIWLYITTDLPAIEVSLRNILLKRYGVSDIQDYE
jgi:uncharacterized protein with HEPN domain